MPKGFISTSNLLSASNRPMFSAKHDPIRRIGFLCPTEGRRTGSSTLVRKSIIVIVCFSIGKSNEKRDAAKVLRPSFMCRPVSRRAQLKFAGGEAAGFMKAKRRFSWSETEARFGGNRDSIWAKQRLYLGKTETRFGRNRGSDRMKQSFYLNPTEVLSE